MSRLYGGFGEVPLREAVIGARLNTFQRAVADLFDEVEELRGALRLMAHRPPWGGVCWCATAPWDDGSARDWKHDHRCCEIKKLMDED